MEQLLLMTSCDSPAGIGAIVFGETHTRTEERTDVKVEIVIYISEKKKKPASPTPPTGIYFRFGL